MVSAPEPRAPFRPVRMAVIDLDPLAVAYPDEATALLERLFARVRIGGVTDAAEPSHVYRRRIDGLPFGGYLENVATSHDLGRPIDATAIRRLAGTAAVVGDQVVVVTARPSLAAVTVAGGLRTVLVPVGDDGWDRSAAEVADTIAGLSGGTPGRP